MAAHDAEAEKIGAHWAKQRAAPGPIRTRWWESPRIRQHYNKLICGESLPDVSAGIVRIIKDRYGHLLPFKRGISVGGSNGWKETILIQKGIVSEFIVTELSGPLIEEGRRQASVNGLSERLTFYLGDAFAAYSEGGSFDFVYWDNSLHHMMNVESAVAWSRKVLRDGGLFVMNDFVGPTRMQFSDVMIECATRARQAMPSEFLRNPHAPGTALDVKIERCDPKVLADEDPSECADSGRILQAVHKVFPTAKTILTGGAIYHTALNDALANFNEDDPKDRAILDCLLQIDLMMAERGETHYAFSMCQKEPRRSLFGRWW